MNSVLLRRRVHELSDAGLSLEQLVGRLRTTVPKYGRYKLRPFTIMVKKIIDSSGPWKKKKVAKKKKVDDGRRKIEPQSESESSETYTSSVLTPEAEPVFDLTKSMLRNTYGNDKLTDVKIGRKRKHVESEVVTDKETANTNDVVVESNNLSNDNDDDNWPRFKDLGGIDAVLYELKMNKLFHIFHPDLRRNLGVKQRGGTGILLHGPPGCGKTTLALAIANETRLPFYKVSAPELVSGISGASEENIRNLFSKAYRTAPSIIFIDEIDAIASKRENLQRGMESRIVTQLMACTAQKNNDGKLGYVLVIGATNRPDAIDPALRRPERFELEIALGVPDENARVQILSSLTRDLKLEGAFDLDKISRSTPGFVGADLVALVNEASNLAMERIVLESIDVTQDEYWWRKPWTPETEKLMITMSDFEAAAKLVQPSLKREGFSSIPNVKWEDIGGHDMLRREFERHLVRRIKYPNYKRKNRENNLEMGFLLYGPPGCGKTLIAKAAANEAGANFIHIKGPELLNKYVGESELAVRTLFDRARTCSPCIIFFDEVDALTTNHGNEGGSVVNRVVKQLLIELDGADPRKGVYVIGATNRPDVMDPALLRPGRLGRKLFVPLPNADERGMILKALSRNFSIGDDVDLIAIGRSEACANFSGADLYALMNEAETIAEDEMFMKLEAAHGETFISEALERGCTVNAIHFEQASARISPSVSHEQKEHYHLLSKGFEQIARPK